jgi:heme/copper-type cytochrome/quinol oxidase subunit 3
MNIPYSSGPRPSTGLYNAKLGMMLFIASEVMLFGALMTSYVFLRTSYTGWAAVGGLLDAGRAAVNTLVMVAASAAMASARVALNRGKSSIARMMLAAAILLGAAFVVLTAIGYRSAFASGLYPSTSTFAAIFYVLTGLHAAHVAGGTAAVALLPGPWSRSWTKEPARLANRVEVAGLYWHFLTALWLVTMSVLYFG